MKLRAILLLSAIVAAGFIAIYVIPLWNSPKLNSQQNDQSAQKSSRRSEWTRTTKYGVELWIAWNEERDPAFGKGQNIFAFIEEKDFKEDNLRKLFTKMAEEYPHHALLTIEIYTDEEKLAWAIYDYRFNGLREVPTPEQLAEEKKPKNYFYAGYFRNVWPSGLVEEGFSYTPDRAKKDMIEIQLKP